MSIALEKRIKTLEEQIKQLTFRMAELEEKEAKPARGRPIKQGSKVGKLKHVN